MPNTALQRITQAILTNTSGSSAGVGDTVIIDTANAASFVTTTTSPFLNGVIGVVLEPNGIAANAKGMIAFAGPVPRINLTGIASIGDLFKTSTTGNRSVRHAPGILAGDFGICTSSGSTPSAILWGMPAGATGAGTGNFSGPGSSVTGHVVTFADTTGQLGQDGGIIYDWTQSLYGPGSNISLGTSTDGGYVDVDATNCKITFTPALAGKYRVTFRFSHYRDGTTIDVLFRLTDSTTTSPIIESYTNQSGSNNTIVVELSYIYTWTAVSQTVKLQKWLAVATAITTNAILSGSSAQGLQMEIVRVGS